MNGVLEAVLYRKEDRLQCQARNIHPISSQSKTITPRVFSFFAYYLGRVPMERYTAASLYARKPDRSNVTATCKPARDAMSWCPPFGVRQTNTTGERSRDQ